MSTKQLQYSIISTRTRPQLTYITHGSQFSLENNRKFGKNLRKRGKGFWKYKLQLSNLRILDAREFCLSFDWERLILENFGCQGILVIV